jgi:hypothetical protein
MILQQRHNMFFPPQFVGSASGANNSPLLGQTQKFQIDRSYPLEEIRIHVNFTVNTGGLTLVTSPSTTDQFDSLLTLIQHVNLSVNDGKQPRSVVDCDGVALLEYQLATGVNVDRATGEVMAYSQTASLPAGNYRMTYRIPIVETWIGEPLRTQMYLPVHTYPQDPVLTLQFQNAANIYSAGNINFVGAEVQLIRRVPTAASEKYVQSKLASNPNGYIDFDLIETQFAVPVGTSSEIRLALPVPGQYATLLCRHYLGGSSITRKEIDNGATGTSFGTENRWRLESAQVTIREWRWKHLLSELQMNQPCVAMLNPAVFVAAASAGSPTTNLQTVQPIFGRMSGGIPSGSGFDYANSVLLNFLTDGMSGDDAVELGSLLDCNTPAQAGLKMEIIGTPTNVSTNASYLKVLGRRYFGNLANWQKLA